MNQEKIIEIKNLSKVYKLGVFNQKSFIEDLEKLIKGDKYIHDPNKFHTALNNISLDIEEGDSLGLIGKNGSGKSTLLKILSRITSPTSGYIRYKGRIVSVLEQGIGFHSELTAFDNIMLNGALLGCDKNFLLDHMNLITNFAGIDQYLNTPIKRYSSGMITRLGFAICAHIPSDILVVDEVLAVGDQEFRNKSINLINNHINVKKKTLLFVSHEMELLKKICNKGVVISKGEIKFSGNIDKAINYYQNNII